MIKVPQIFDNKRLKSHFANSHFAVIKLQNLLTEILQERLQLFSRNFFIQAQHFCTKCSLNSFSVAIDPEALPFKHQSLDLAFSVGPLMFTNDIPGILKQWYFALKPGGVFMASFFGEDTLVELKNCFLSAEEALRIPHSLRFFPTIATKDAGVLMQRAGFHLPMADRTRHVFQVKCLRDLLVILKAMGGNILYDRSRSVLSKEFFKAVEEEYLQRYSFEKQLNVTVDIICMTGWAIERYAEERIQQNKQKIIGYI